MLNFKSELERERELMYQQFERVRDVEDRLRALSASCVHELEAVLENSAPIAPTAPDAEVRCHA